MTQPVGEHLKYTFYAQDRPIACLSWSSAPRHLGSRDRFIGWSPQARLQNIRLLAYNSRFLIMPWVSVEHLASHLLARMAKVVSLDWQRVYGHPLYFLETFIDPQRFRGTCYRAANCRAKKFGASCWVKVPAGKGLTTHPYRVLRLRRSRGQSDPANKADEAYTENPAGRRGHRGP